MVKQTCTTTKEFSHQKTPIFFHIRDIISKHASTTIALLFHKLLSEKRPLFFPRKNSHPLTRSLPFANLRSSLATSFML